MKSPLGSLVTREVATSGSCVGHLGLTQSDGQLQVLLLLLSQPLQPLSLRSLTLPFSPLQLLSFVPELHTRGSRTTAAAAQDDVTAMYVYVQYTHFFTWNLL